MWIETKYIGLMSGRLDRFRKVQGNTYNFRCPVCGDSQKDKRKARGYLYPKDNTFLFHCHNCTMTMNFPKFIQTIDPILHDEYCKESLLEKYKPREKTEVEEFADKMKKPVFVKTTELKTLKKISQLKHDHPVKQYVVNRKIPTPYHAKLFYAPKFKKFVNRIIPNKFENVEYDEPRLIIPFLDEEKKLFGFQGRSFSKKGLRYITIMLDESKPKIFGLDTVDTTKTHYALEGPIDSMFLENAIAMAGQSIDISVCNENTVFVFDNEPRNSSTIAKMEKVIAEGFRIVIFPKTIREKDINDIVLHTEIDIESLLCNNSYTGLSATATLSSWRDIR